MRQLWEVRIRPRVQKILARMSRQELRKMRKTIEKLERYGPHLESETGGDTVHALKGIRYGKIKQLTMKSGRAAWRFAYYIDNKQIVHILAGGDKRGVSQKLFYQRLKAEAEREYEAVERGE